MSNDKQRDSLGKYIGNKYKKIDGKWYRSKCLDCNCWLQRMNQKRCWPCYLKTDRLHFGNRTYKKSDHWNWKGGVTDKSKAIRNSKEYAEWRKAVFKRDNYICQQCQQHGHELQADHIKPFSTHIHLRFELSNGRTLCKDCHLKTATWGRKATYAS